MSSKLGKPKFTISRTFTISERRRIVAQMYLTGRHTMETIAEDLTERGIECSPATVSLDLKFMREQSALAAARDMNAWRNIELEKLDYMEQMLSDANLPLKFILEGGDLDLVDGFIDASTALQNRAEKAIEIMLKIQDRRTKLLGLDAPKKIAVEGGDPNKPIRTSEVSDEELEAILRSTEKVQ